MVLITSHSGASKIDAGQAAPHLHRAPDQRQSGGQQVQNLTALRRKGRHSLRAGIRAVFPGPEAAVRPPARWTMSAAAAIVGFRRVGQCAGSRRRSTKGRAAVARRPSGFALSGGEQQRLAVARAVVNAPTHADRRRRPAISMPIGRRHPRRFCRLHRVWRDRRHRHPDQTWISNVITPTWNCVSITGGSSDAAPGSPSIARRSPSAFRRLGRRRSTPCSRCSSSAVALTLPNGLRLCRLDNLRDLGASASGVQQISVFMHSTPAKEGNWRNRKPLRAATPAAMAIRAGMRRSAHAATGMAESSPACRATAARRLRHPGRPTPSPRRWKFCAKGIAGWPRVAHVQLDSAWVKRFDAFLASASWRCRLALPAVRHGLVAVTFNTIRLGLGAVGRDQVARMIGATDAFIRRPFYYFGALQARSAACWPPRWSSAPACSLAGPVATRRRSMAAASPCACQAVLAVLLGRRRCFLSAGSARNCPSACRCAEI